MSSITPVTSLRPGHPGFDGPVFDDPVLNEMVDWIKRTATKKFNIPLEQTSFTQRKSIRLSIAATIGVQDGPGSERLDVLATVFDHLAKVFNRSPPPDMQQPPEQPRARRPVTASRLSTAPPPPMTDQEMEQSIRYRFSGDNISITGASEEIRKTIHDDLRGLIAGAPLSFSREDLDTFDRVWRALFPAAATTATSAPPPELPPQPFPNPPGPEQQRISTPPLHMTRDNMAEWIRSRFPEGNLRVDANTRAAIYGQLEQAVPTELSEIFQQAWAGLFAATADNASSAPPPPGMSTPLIPPTTTVPAAGAASGADIAERRGPVAERAPPQPPETDDLEITSSDTPPRPQKTPEEEWEERIRKEFENLKDQEGLEVDPQNTTTRQRKLLQKRLCARAERKREVELFRRVWSQVITSFGFKTRLSQPDASTAPRAKKVHRGDLPNQPI